MYKDVWKKFGGKILIVVCSVLLLGGVAFAAPRLRAEDLKKSINDVQFCEETPTTGPAIYIPDNIKNGLMYDIDVSGSPKKITPSCLMYMDENGDSHNMYVDEDYTISEDENTNHAGSTSVRITATEKNKYFRFDLVSLPIKYIIQKRNISNIGQIDVKVNGDGYLKASKDNIATLSKDDLTVGIQATGEYGNGYIEIPSSDYDLIENTSYNTLGKNTYKISFHNYLHNNGNYAGACYVKKSVEYLDVYYKENENDPDDKAIPLDRFVGEQNKKPENLVVKDGEDVVEESDVARSVVGDSGASPYVFLKADESSTEYYGTASVGYKVTAKDFNPMLPDGFSNVVDYDESRMDGRGYIKMPVRLKDAVTKEALVSGNDYFPLTEDDFSIIDLQNKNEKIEGATAGVVSIKVRGKGLYLGASAEIRYFVRRSLKNGKVTVETVPPKNELQTAFEYGDGKEHKPEFDIYFNDSPDYKLKVDKDFKIKYTNVLDRDASVLTEETTEAGTVSMLIEGTAGDDIGGYYGTYGEEELKDYYPINPKFISAEEGYELNLDPSSKNPGKFFYTGQKINVTDKAVVKRASDGSSINISGLIEGNDYDIYFLDSEGKDIDPPVECGSYQVEYYFHGNYAGELRANFTIEPLPMRDCRIHVGKCDREKAEGEHIYDQQEHRPEITVTYTNPENRLETIDIPISAFDVTYDNNTKPGTATVTVTTSNGSSKSETFEILDTDISGFGDIKLPEEYRERENNKKYHTYTGKKKWPELKTVLIDGTELKEGEDYTVTALCFEDGTAVTSETYPKIDKDYKFKITGINGYKGEGFTESFQLLRKNIGDVSVKYTDLSRSDQVDLGEVDEKTYVEKNLHLTDSEFDDELSLKDYTIESVKSQKNQNGTVTVTIKANDDGCYSGSKTFTYNVGQDIATATVYDRSNPCAADPATGELWLKNDAKLLENGKYNVPFAEENNSLSSKVYLRDLQSKPLLREQQYTVEAFVGLGYKDEKPYAKAILQGKSGYYGRREIYFYVRQITLGIDDMTVIEITASDDDLKYTGYSIEPGIKVMYNGEVVNPDYYDVDFKNNVNAGEATVTVTGKLSYKGTATTTFTISPRPLDDPCVWIEGLEKSYKYTEETKETGADGKEHTYPGVRPQVQVCFDPLGRNAESDKFYVLEEGDNKDYKRTYTNEQNGVWTEGTNVYIAPTIIITARANGNFSGVIKKTFEITPIDLESECEVIVLEPNAIVFDGLPKEPKIEVRRLDNKAIVPETAYKKEWNGSNNVFVSGNLEEQMPEVWVIPADGNKNYIGKCSSKYTIRGDLSRSSELRAKNSEVLVEEEPTDYIESGNYDPANFFIIQFKEKKNDTGWPDTGSQQQIPLIYGEDYTIRANTDTVGAHPATITGTGRFFGILNNYAVVIRGDLGADYTTFKDPGVIAIDSIPADPKAYLADRIAPVVCGGKTLKYGVDYDFETVPKMDLGTWEVMIRPTKEAGTDGNGYLTGSRSITYTVKQGIEGFYIDGLKASYEYKHGEPVITEADFRVYASEADVAAGKEPLYYDEDYVISEESKLTDVGQGRLVIVGIGDYAGKVQRQLEIVPYDLGENYKNGNLKLTYNSKPEYSGSQISAEELGVEIQTSDGKYTIDPQEYKVVVDPNTGADYVNRTKDGDVVPTFTIVGNNVNYKGTIDGEPKLTFRIQPKPLTQDMFTLPSEVEYHEKDTAPPAPEGLYNGVAMSGVRYQTDMTDFTGYDFSYTYSPTDTKTGGEKTVIITGHNNFSGDVSLVYTVTKKDINSSDIVLTLTTPEPYVYNGQAQTPAFELTYEGESILVYDGANAVVTRLADPVVTYENNENAGKGIIHILTSENDPNYTGQKDYAFTIEKLAIDDHIRFLYGADRRDLATFTLSYDWEQGVTKKPDYLMEGAEEIGENSMGVEFVYTNGSTIPMYFDKDYTVEASYIEPDSEDTPIREEYSKPDPEFSYAGKVKVVITAKSDGNYTGSAGFIYFIGTDISTEGSSRLQKDTTVFNAQQQWPVEIVNGLDESRYKIVRYRHAVAEENILGDKKTDKTAFIDADTYYVRIEGNPAAGTYASKPIQLTYTILPRSINHVLIDGYKAEYSYTGSAICPVGLTVTDPIDDIRYKLTEDKDYTISYSNNINAGVASIIIKGLGNYDTETTATARFTITSSTISSGSSGGNGGGNYTGSSDGSSGQIAGPSAVVSADDVRLTMDTSDAMYYTGSALYPGVYIPGMTENIDYTVTFSNNTDVGQGVVTIHGINNSSGVITRTFRIIADLSKCKVADIPDQAYTGLAVTPGVTITCGQNTLLQGTDYTLSYANNTDIGTASVIITAANGSNYVGTVTVKFSIGNGISSAVISGYSSHYTYTGSPITPAISVVAGSATLREGTDYTVEYADNTNAGTATITVTGKGAYSGTQKVTFVIDPKNISSLTTTDVSSKKYTGDAYTPGITVSDGGKTLTNGVDYTVTYTNNTNPGVASIIVQALNDNYTGTKTINFRIGTVAVSNFHAGNIKATSLTLAWTAQDYASGYQICDADSRVVKNSSKNKITLIGLKSGKTYKYKVRSYIRRSDGTRAYGSFSTVISATTKLKTPTVKAACKGKGKARVRWSKVSGATGYQVFYSTSATKGFKKLKTTKNTVRVLNIKGLKSGQRYFFRVRAYKKVGSKNIYSNYNSLKAITVK